MRSQLLRAEKKYMYSENVFKLQRLATAETHFNLIVVNKLESERVKTEKVDNRPMVADLSLGIILLSCVICFLMLSKLWTTT